MSADNWDVCPTCAKKDPFNGASERTWREDYELGIDRDGDFYVRYRGGCRVCGSSVEFDHTEHNAVKERLVTR